MISTVDAEHSRMLKNLTILGEMKLNDKLCTADDIFVIHEPTYLRALYRIWYREARDANINRIAEVVSGACGYVSLSDKHEAEVSGAVQQYLSKKRVRMIEALGRARLGLQNMAKTYAHDTTVRVQISRLIARSTITSR